MRLPLCMPVLTTTLPVNGMSCASCAVSVESIAKTLPGIRNATVNLATNTVQLAYDRPAVLEQLQKNLSAMGYELALEADDALAAAEEAQHKKYRYLKRQLLGASLLSAPVVILGMFFMDLPGGNWYQLLLSTPVLFWFGRQFFRNAWAQLKHRKANMDTLVALSTSIAWSFSAFNTAFPDYWHQRGLHPHVYFESAAVIITFILLGRVLEERAKSSTASALRKLMGLQPQTVQLLRGQQTVPVALSAIQPGDRLLVRVGDQIPVDGVLAAGSGYVDEALLSGEPLPVAKIVGDRLYAGTLNRDGRLELEATGVGRDTLLARIVERVQQAQGSKAPVQALVDRIAAVFVPVVLGIALLTFGLWYFLGGADAFSQALLAAITVLVIACPCALGLATPTAIMVGMGKGAAQGILIRDASSLEKSQQITQLVLDKTGTLTTGKPVVDTLVWHRAGLEQKGAWEAIWMALEGASDHPLAESIGQKLADDGVQAIALEQVKTHPGKGVSGHFAGGRWLAGSDRWLQEEQIPIAPELEQQAAQARAEGASLVWLAHEQQAVAFAVLRDELKPEAVASLRRLEARGLRIHLLTGDHPAAAQFMAARAGIKHLLASASPTQKGDYIAQLQAEGGCVAMVGDGINDSEALARADLSIAMGNGSDVAIDVAEMTLLHNDLSRIETALNLSAATVKTIRQNLFWAFIYNFIGIPLAAGILYPVNGFLLDPMLAAAAMALSSVSVVSNSLLLNYRKIN